MLKRYFSIGEAASFLTFREHHLIHEQDIYELACRGDVRLCFWFEGRLYHLAADIDEPGLVWRKRADYRFRGYLQIPQARLSPAGGVIEFGDAEIVEAIGTTEPAMPAKMVDDDPWTPVHFGFATYDNICKAYERLTISVDCEEAVVPLVDLMKIADKDSVTTGNAAQREHVSDSLAKMNQAAVKFWANADRNDRTTHPSNGTVADWLESQGLSPSLAQKAASLIRPDWAPPGRKPEK